MKYLSTFSGIEGFGYGLEQAGFEQCVAQIEKDPYCNSVRQRHWPHTPQYKDIRNVDGRKLPKADVFTGGFPCQDLSVAGKRAGLAGSRSGLWHEFARLIEEAGPHWLFIENVPGLLSSGKRRDMGILLGRLAELGYWWAYRVLDAQYYGLAQRRRRVFIVANSANPTYPAKVLFEPESCDWDTPPSREAGESTSAPLKAGAPSRRNGGSNPIPDEFIVDFGRTADRIRIGSEVSATLQGEGGGGNSAPAVAFQQNTRDEVRKIGGDGQVVGVIASNPGAKQQNYIYQWASGGGDDEKDTAQALRSEAEHNYQIVHNQFCVRRLTPTECERLQGFPDDWTKYGKDGESISDAQRYKMLGNAVPTPVVEWIGRRMLLVEKGKL